jgi:hypothetical protein
MMGFDISSIKPLDSTTTKLPKFKMNGGRWGQDLFSAIKKSHILTELKEKVT